MTVVAMVTFGATAVVVVKVVVVMVLGPWVFESREALRKRRRRKW